MEVMKRKVVEVGKSTVKCCVIVVGSTGVLLEWSVDKRDCSEEGDGDCLYVRLRASGITFILLSMYSMVMSS